tara:strand:- start:694 stop:924 length:231 start_codon:yes stop_codon:yes gene_type:complete
MSLDPTPAPITVRIKDACRMTGIGRSKLCLLIAEGEIETIKIGSMTLIPRHVPCERHMPGAADDINHAERQKYHPA